MCSHAECSVFFVGSQPKSYRIFGSSRRAEKNWFNDNIITCQKIILFTLALNAASPVSYRCYLALLIFLYKGVWLVKCVLLLTLENNRLFQPICDERIWSPFSVGCVHFHFRCIRRFYFFFHFFMKFSANRITPNR